MAKLYGDVSEKEKKLAEGLEEHESWLDKKKDVPALIAAKMLVCLAHDWYDLAMDDEGERLLTKADKICPGYFRKAIVDQTIEDPEFAYLILNLQRLIATDILSVLGTK